MTTDTETLPESQAVMVRPSMAVGQAMTVHDILAQVKLVQDVMRSVMKENEHYGTIPGCGDKKTLLQPGAQKLTMTFRLAPEYEIQESNLDRGHKEYRVICTLKSMGSGAFVGQGVGVCSSMESKYRYRTGEGVNTGRPVPKDYWNDRNHEKLGGKGFIPRKTDEGWFIFEKGERVENDNPADTFNTVLKIAKKRAFVDATITATAASDIFTQDIGDDETDLGENDSKLSKTPQDASRPPSTSHNPPPATPQGKPEGKAPLNPASRNIPEDAENVRFEDLPAGKPAERGTSNVPQTVSVPRDEDADVDSDKAPWRSFPVPWGRHSGVPLGKLDKNVLWGFWENFVVEEEYNGKRKAPATIAKDKKFRAYLDQAGQHYEFKHPGEEENPEDQVPF